MTMTTPGTMTTTELGAAADARTAELDVACRLPADLYAAALHSGLFRPLVAPEFGGNGAAPLQWFRTGVELAWYEASLAWVVTQGAAELGWIAAGGDPMAEHNGQIDLGTLEHSILV